MLIRSVRFYERVLNGLYSPNLETVQAAESCLSWFVFHMKNRQLALPPAVEAVFKQLPEV